MPKETLGEVLRFLHKTYPHHEARQRTDGELLSRFVTDGEEAAFRVLVERHGPMVQGVCRRVLGNFHAAEDSFQATFLVLARRAASICLRESLGSWLYAVARRIALRAKVESTAQRNLKRRVVNMPQADHLDDVTWLELRAILDEEIGRLPEKYRAPLVLCYFESKTRKRAAQELGWPEGTLARRLSRGRELLRQQLVRRGITLSAGVLGVVLTEKVAAAPVAALLTVNTVKAAAGLLSGKAVAAAYFSARALALAEDAMTGMFWIKGKLVLLVLAFALVGSGAGWAGYHMLADSSQGTPAARSEAPAKQPKEEPRAGPTKPPVDLYGDPLPPGAVNRIGSSRFRHEGAVTSVLYTQDGKALISTSRDGLLRLWEAATGKLRWRHAIGTDSFSIAMAISGDGKRLAVLGSSEYHLVSIETGKSIFHCTWPKAGDDMAGRVAITPDGSTLARGCWDGTLRLYDAANGEEKRRIVVGDKAKEQTAWAMMFSSDARMLYVVVYQKPGIMAYDTTTGMLVRTLGSEEGLIRGLHVSQDRRLLVVMSRGRGDNPDRLVLWDLAKGKQLHVIETVFPDPLAGAFSPDGRFFAVGSQGKDIVLFDTASGKEYRRLVWHPSTVSLAFAPDGTTLASGDGGGCIGLWSVATGKLILRAPEQGSNYHGIRFMNDGKQLLTLGDGIARWDVASGRVLKWLPREPSWYFCQAVSADGKLLSIVLKNGDWLVVDTVTGRHVRTFTARPGFGFHGSSFAPDGTKLFSIGGFDPRVIIWDMATGKRLRELESHTSYADRVVVSPNGQWLASAGSEAAARGDYDIRLWEIATGKLVHRLTPRRGSALAMLFSSDSSQLVSVGGEPGRLNDRGEVQLWDVATGKELRAFVGHEERVVCAALTPDGQMLATGSIDKTLRLWEVDSGLERGRIAGHEGYVHSLDFSPDGRLLAAASDDAPVYIWDAYRHAHSGFPVTKLTKEDGARLWQSLASMDGPTSYQAVCALIAHPHEAVPLLQDGLKRSPRASAEQVRQWLRELDSKQFATRKRATTELLRFQAGHEGLLKQVLEQATTLEVRQRVEQILRTPNAERLRRTRMLEVLERVNNDSARRFLEYLVTDTGDAQLSQQAAAGLKRLQHR